jgi:hypothetical protein
MLRTTSLRILARNFHAKTSKTIVAVNFDDPKAAFQSKTTRELMLHSMVFKVCSYDSIVRNCNNLINLGEKIVGKELLSSLVLKPTFFYHFCGELLFSCLVLSFGSSASVLVPF